MKFTTKYKTRIEKIKTEILAVYYASKHPDLPLMPRIIILFTLGYALSPIDLIPDFIPVIGYLDDLIILPILISLSIKCIPVNIMEDARKQARKRPVTLKKNWRAGILIALLWAIIISSLIYRLTG